MSCLFCCSWWQVKTACRNLTPEVGWSVNSAFYYDYTLVNLSVARKWKNKLLLTQSSFFIFFKAYYHITTFESPWQKLPLLSGDGWVTSGWWGRYSQILKRVWRTLMLPEKERQILKYYFAQTWKRLLLNFAHVFGGGCKSCNMLSVKEIGKMQPTGPPEGQQEEEKLQEQLHLGVMGKGHKNNFIRSISRVVWA